MRSILQKLFLITNLGGAWSLVRNNFEDSRLRAAYFLDDDPAGNSLVSLNISVTDGTLAKPVRTPTGGKGLAGLMAVSQDSVIVSQQVRLPKIYRFSCPKLANNNSSLSISSP